MVFSQFLQDDGDDAIRIRDVVVPPLRRSSSISRLVHPVSAVYCGNHASDHIFSVVQPKKKKRGLFSWLGGGDDDCCIVSTKSVIEPQQLLLRRQSSCSSLATRVHVSNHKQDLEVLECIICRTPHQSTCFSSFDQGCCLCTGNGHSHKMCHYQRHRYRHRHRHHHSHQHRPHRHDHDHQHDQHSCNGYRGHSYDSSFDDGYDDFYAHRHRHSSSHRLGGSRGFYWDMPWSAGEREMRRRGERYKNSTEHEWREELINLMAEQREEMAWERHHLEIMPEFEKTDFIYRDTQERNDRISQLTELVEQAKEANLQRYQDRNDSWDFD